MPLPAAAPSPYATPTRPNVFSLHPHPESQQQPTLHTLSRPSPCVQPLCSHHRTPHTIVWHVSGWHYLRLHCQKHLGECWLVLGLELHRPLALSLPLASSSGFLARSFCFDLFGDHLWVEKLYSVATILLSAFLTAKLWTSVGGKRYLSWLPLLLLLLVPRITWTAMSNILENTMMVFVLFAATCVIRSLSSRRWLWLSLARLSLFAASCPKDPRACIPSACLSSCG